MVSFYVCKMRNPQPRYKIHILQIAQKKSDLFLQSDDFCNGFSVICKLR